jgi:hypothetical protein
MVFSSNMLGAKPATANHWLDCGPVYLPEVLTDEASAMTGCGVAGTSCRRGLAGNQALPQRLYLASFELDQT